MNKTALLAISILAFAGARLEAGSTLAGNGSSRIDTGIERAIVRYTATYENLIGGTFTCVGFRLSNRSFTSDRQECTMTDLSTWPAGTYIGNPNYNVNGQLYTWTSDYDAATAHHVRIIITDNGDGTGHVDVEAYY